LDIKPDNILISSERRDQIESSQICLIDYGIAKPWRNPDYTHIEKRQLDRFCGNVLFASRNAFKGQSLSRRDDLISLVYLLCFLVNGEFTWLGNLRMDHLYFFRKVTKIKIKMKPVDICVNRAYCFYAFCEEIFRLRFKETPPYGQLKHLLTKCLLDMNRVPDARFDWSKFRVRPMHEVEAQLLGPQ
jgi:serine/threonine protein kinase